MHVGSCTAHRKAVALGARAAASADTLLARNVNLCAGAPFPATIQSGVQQSCCDNSTQYGYFTNAENTTTACCGNGERGTPRISACRVGVGAVEV